MISVGIDVFTFDKDQCVSYKDGDKLNVSIDNLFCTYRGNLIQGDKHKFQAKLSEEDVIDIKRRYSETIDNRPVNQHDNDKPYNSYRSLAEEYGVTYPLIRQIIEGSAWDSEKYILKEDEIK